jgi:molybdopterin synthase sulfur carrier subunit
MTVSVRIPTVLRSYTGGAAEVEVEGRSVGEVLDRLEAEHPGIRSRIVDEQGALRRFVNVYVGNDDVRFVDGLGTPVPDGVQISVIPSVAGGAERP